MQTRILNTSTFPFETAHKLKSQYFNTRNFLQYTYNKTI